MSTQTGVARIMRGATGTVVAVALGVGAGVLSARAPLAAAIAAAAILVIAIAFVDLSALLVLSFLGTFLINRVGPMSVADYAIAAGSVIALVISRGRGLQSLQPLLWCGAFYLGLTFPQLFLNRYGENWLEWAHEVVLVLGSMVLGFAIGREGKARTALSLFVVMCCGMAVAAIILNLQGADGYVGMWHKNAVGSFLMVAALIAFANPVWLGWRPAWAYAAFGVCLLGMLESRQAVVGTLVGALIIGMRPRFHNGKRSRLMLLVVVPAAVFVYLEISEQLAQGSSFDSVSQRIAWYGDSIVVWMLSPLYGVGHRWWTTWHTGYGGFQPPNAELEVLTTTGVIGLIGFIGMFAGALWLLWRMDPTYGTLGLAVVAARFVQGQFDLYWAAPHAAILWIVAGICYGVRERDHAHGVRRVPHPVQTVFRRHDVWSVR